MKLFRFASTAALCVLLAGVLAAQSAPQTQPAPRADQAAPRANQPAAQATDAADITIVGCLAQAQGAADADAYTLTIAPAADAAQAAAAHAPAANPNDAARAANPADAARAENANANANAAAAAAAPKNAATTYRITGIAADQLKPHINHQVELKGRPNAAAAAAAGQAQAASAQEFRATSVKMLSATCPPAK